MVSLLIASGQHSVHLLCRETYRVAMICMFVHVIPAEQRGPQLVRLFCACAQLQSTSDDVVKFPRL